MVNVYDYLKDEYGNLIQGRTKIFIMTTLKDYSIGRFMSGQSCVPLEPGTLFIVDEWLVEQIEKVQFVNGELSVKDGEELIPPVKSEKELQREALLKQLAELDSQPDEEVNVDG